MRCTVIRQANTGVCRWSTVRGEKCSEKRSDGQGVGQQDVPTGGGFGEQRGEEESREWLRG
jgi:hypothetical protein